MLMTPGTAYLTLTTEISLFLTLQKLFAEFSEFPFRPFCYIVLQPRTVLLSVLDLDLFKVPRLPVKPH